MNFWAQANPSAWLELYKELSSYGLPGALVVFVGMLYFRFVRWGKDYDERVAQLQDQIKKLEELNTNLTHIAVRGLDVVEVQHNDLRKDVLDRARLEDVNRHLREKGRG